MHADDRRPGLRRRIAVKHRRARHVALLEPDYIRLDRQVVRHLVGEPVRGATIALLRWLPESSWTNRGIASWGSVLGDEMLAAAAR